MAKQSAIGANLYLTGYDLSGDVGAITNISGSRSTVEVTAINQSAPQRLLARRDGNVAFSGFWNTTAGQIEPQLAAMPSTDVLATIAIPASSSYAVGDVGCGLNGKQLNFNQAFGADGSLGVTTEITANSTGLEWGQLLTAGKASIATGTVNGTSIDLGAVSTLFGCAAYLHVFAMASGTMSLKLQDSADNSSWADITGGAFTDSTGVNAQRIQTTTSTTIRRYVRLAASGTHATATVAVLFVRYLTDQSI